MFEMFRLEGSELFIQTVQSKTRLNLKKICNACPFPIYKKYPLNMSSMVFNQFKKITFVHRPYKVCDFVLVHRQAIITFYTKINLLLNICIEIMIKKKIFFFSITRCMYLFHAIRTQFFLQFCQGLAFVLNYSLFLIERNNVIPC